MSSALSNRGLRSPSVCVAHFRGRLVRAPYVGRIFPVTVFHAPLETVDDFKKIANINRIPRHAVHVGFAEYYDLIEDLDRLLSSRALCPDLRVYEVPMPSNVQIPLDLLDEGILFCVGSLSIAERIAETGKSIVVVKPKFRRHLLEDLDNVFEAWMLNCSCSGSFPTDLIHEFMQLGIVEDVTETECTLDA